MQFEIATRGPVRQALACLPRRLLSLRQLIGHAGNAFPIAQGPTPFVYYSTHSPDRQSAC